MNPPVALNDLDDGRVRGVPAYYEPMATADPARMPVRNPAVTDEDLLDPWNAFDDPRLRWVQELGLRSAPSASEINSRLIEAGYPDLASSAAHGEVSARRVLMIQLARAVTDARYHLHQLRAIDQQLKALATCVDAAEDRVEVGSVTGVELVQLLSRAKETEAMRPAEVTKRDAALERVELLVGRPLTGAFREALGDQPALRLGEIAAAVPAKELRNRCDVDSAAREVRRFAMGSGIPEAELLPRLALRGLIRPESSSETNDGFDPMAMDLGDFESMDFSLPAHAAVGDANFQSRLHRAMSGYHSTVLSASSEVRELLTEYLRLRTQAKKLEETRSRVLDRWTELLDRFEVDEAKIADVALTQSRLIEVESDFHRAERQLALAAIDLFIAIGGPCQLDQVVRADYYERL